MKKKTISSAMLTVLLSSTMLPTITAAQEMTTSSTTENAITSSEVIAEDKEEEEGKHTTVSSAPREGIVDDIESGIEKDIEQAKNDAIQRIEKLAEAKLIDDAGELIGEIVAAAESGAETAVADIEKIASEAEQAAYEKLLTQVKVDLAEIKRIEAIPGEVIDSIEEDIRAAEVKAEQDVQGAIADIIEIQLKIKNELIKQVEADLAKLKAIPGQITADIEEELNAIKDDAEKDVVTAIHDLMTVQEKIKTALENAVDSELQKIKDDAIKEVEELKNLGAEEIDKAVKEIEAAADAAAVAAISDAAKELHNLRQGFIDDINKLKDEGTILEDDAEKFIEKIKTEVEEEAMGAIVKAATEIAKVRQDAIAEIEKLEKDGKILEADATKFIEKIKSEIEADAIADITKAASELQKVRQDAIDEINKLVEEGELLQKEADEYIKNIEQEIEADVIKGITEAANALHTARADAIKELEHLRDLGVLAEEEFDKLVDQVRNEADIAIIDGIALVHLEEAKLKAISEVDALLLIGDITVEEAHEYKEQIHAATKPSEITAILNQMSLDVAFKDLDAAIAKADTRNERDYMPDTWQKFNLALTNAKVVAATKDTDNPASPEEIRKALDSLLSSEEALVRIASTQSINNLDRAIKLAHSKDESKYTKITWANMQGVLKEAEAMQADINAHLDAYTRNTPRMYSNPEVNNMANKLMDSIENLVLVSPSKLPKPHTPTKPAAFKPASKPAAASASAPSASAPSASAPKAAASSLPKTGEVTHSLMSAGLLALGMAGYFYMSRKRLEVSGDITDF